MKECQLCNHGSRCIVYDAKLPNGRWAWMCHNCFVHYGCKLGTGFGQKYELTAPDKWTKIAG